MLNHESLENYYKTTFAMVQHHKYKIEELENMIPWERYLYLDLLFEYLQSLENE